MLIPAKMPGSGEMQGKSFAKRRDRLLLLVGGLSYLSEWMFMLEISMTNKEHSLLLLGGHFAFAYHLLDRVGIRAGQCADRKGSLTNLLMMYRLADSEARYQR